jgi:hypothetical protein
MFESEVLRGRTTVIPKPAVTESFCSGRISPNKSGFDRGSGGEVVRSIGEVSARRYDVDFEADTFVVTVLLGLLIRLAKDRELLDS